MRTDIKSSVRQFIAGSLLLGGLVLGGTSCDKKPRNPKYMGPAKKEVVKPETETGIVAVQHIDFTKKYVINDRADFDTLYNIAKPFIFASLVPTENWRPDFHNDRQKNTGANSAGVGLFYVGVDKNGNLDFSSTNWIKTRDFFNNYKKKYKSEPKNMTPDQMYDGTCGWFENMENARHLKELFKHLKGAELTINEFTAIVSVYYNDNVIGKEVCNYVVKNYTNPRACAKYILRRKAEMPGIKSRRVHEALVYLNHDSYCFDIYSLKVDGKVNTSVTGGTKYRAILLKQDGFTNANLSAAKNAICCQVVKNGKSVKTWISGIHGKSQDDILAFCVPTTSSVEMQKRDDLYDFAMTKYDNGEYQAALELFQKVVQQNGNSADLHNDMAIAYYHLGQYGKCIEQCHLALATDEADKYMFAYYNAGLAREAKKDYTRAIVNYKKAIEYASKFGAPTERKQVYKNALERVQKLYNKQQPKTPAKKKSGKKTAFNYQQALSTWSALNTMNKRNVIDKHCYGA